MTVNFAQKLAQMPHYEAGLAIDAARERYGTGDVIKLASNESPWGPHADVIEAVARAAGELNRYPEQFSPTLRRRLAERHETEPGRVAVGNGSCEILLAACEAPCASRGRRSSSPGRRSRCTRTWRRSPGAREVRVPLGEGGVHDLDAMLAEVTAATQLLLICNPNNPTATPHPGD